MPKLRIKVLNHCVTNIGILIIVSHKRNVDCIVRLCSSKSEVANFFEIILLIFMIFTGLEIYALYNMKLNEFQMII